MKTLKERLKKLLSTKFIAAMTGVVSGIAAVCADKTTAGIVLIATSIVTYLIAEGYIDAKAVNTAAVTIATVADAVEDFTENETIDAVAETVGDIADGVASATVTQEDDE